MTVAEASLSLLYPAAVVVLGYVVLGLTGFGSALVTVPLLSWYWPLPQVVALALLLDVPASALHAGLNLKVVNFSEFSRLLPGMAVGSAVGLLLAGGLDPKWPLCGLGLYVATVGIRALCVRRDEPARLSAAWCPAAGAAAGLVEVLFATAGPVVLAWLQRRLTDVRAVRATTPVVMLVCASTALLVMAAAGELAQGLLWERWALLLGLALFGVALGNRWACHIPAAKLRRLICALLVASGLALTRHAWA